MPSRAAGMRACSVRQHEGGMLVAFTLWGQLPHRRSEPSNLRRGGGGTRMGAGCSVLSSLHESVGRAAVIVSAHRPHFGATTPTCYPASRKGGAHRDQHTAPHTPH